MRRLSLVSIIAALSLTASASTATAQVTVGQVGIPDTNCRAGDWAQPIVSSGTPYVIPVTGTLSSWSHIARVAAGQKMKVKVFRQVPGLPTTYTVVGQDVPRDLNSGTINTFATNIPVQAGDVLGMTTLSAQGASGVGCGFGAPTETVLNKEGSDAPTGSEVVFESIAPVDRLNISAVIEPTPGATILTCKGQQVTIVGTEGPDTLLGTAGADVIGALGGNDNASGLGGKDIICGGAGKDTLKGGKGKDQLLGQAGRDKLKGGGGNDTCKGGKGSDSASACEVEKSI